MIGGWRTTFRPSDLDPSDKVETTCRRCGLLRYETAGDLARRFDQRYFDEIERALRCRCGGPVRLALTHGGKVEGFQGGMP